MLSHNVCNKLEIFAVQYFTKVKTSSLQRVNTNHHFVTFVPSPLKSLAFGLCTLLKENSIRSSFASFLIVIDIFCHHLTQIHSCSVTLA